MAPSDSEKRSSAWPAVALIVAASSIGLIELPLVASGRTGDSGISGLV